MAEENIFQEKQQSQSPSKKEKNTGMAIVAYILFFVPLLTKFKNDPFVKYHVKQGLVLFIGWIVIAIIDIIFPSQLLIISRLFSLCLFVLLIIGIINALKGEQKPLPVIGKLGEQIKF